MLRPVKKIFTQPEYLAMERVAEYKSEYYDGEIFAMVGGTVDHSLIAVNLISELNTRLAATPCRVFNSDMRLHIEASGLYTYPDLMVICDRVEFAGKGNDIVLNPLLIAEILSESTRSYDRGAKFNFYKQIPALREYITFESEYPHIECYHRGDNDQWSSETYDDLNTTVEIKSIACEILLRQIYNKVSWLDMSD